jgi:hypothetical protein
MGANPFGVCPYNRLMATQYEWMIETVEVVDGEEEVIDSLPLDNLESAGELDADQVLVLVRRQGCHGDCNVSWAYVRDGKLAPEFSDAGGRFEAKVPKRFVAQFERERG